MKTKPPLIALLVRTTSLALLVGARAASGAPDACAHNGKSHIEGTVTSVEKKKLVVKQQNGRSVSIRLGEETSYRLRETGVQTSAADLTVGRQVLVESFGMPGAEQHALEVILATPMNAPSEPATE